MELIKEPDEKLLLVPRGAAASRQAKASVLTGKGTSSLTDAIAMSIGTEMSASGSSVALPRGCRGRDNSGVTGKSACEYMVSLARILRHAQWPVV